MADMNEVKRMALSQSRAWKEIRGLTSWARRLYVLQIARLYLGGHTVRNRRVRLPKSKKEVNGEN